MMYAFLDESGIHLTTGHSVFVGVLVESDDMPRVQQALLDVEQATGFPSFHWSNMRWNTRKIAFEALRPLPFRFKMSLQSNPIKNSNTIMEGIFHELLPIDSIRHIYIDGKKSKAYNAYLKAALRSTGIKSHKLTTANDAASPGIRIADLIAGLARHQLDKPSAQSAELWHWIAEKEQ